MTDAVPTSKLCCKCQEAKPAREFFRHRSTSDGLRSRCKACEKGHPVRPRDAWRHLVEKTCTNCHVCKPIECFWHRRPGGPRLPRCKDCLRAQRRPCTSEQARQCKLRSKYGMEACDYDTVLARQGGGCAICGDLPGDSTDSRALHVDHCHASGEVRGILCALCNRGLGLFSDDVARLAGAIVYLAETQGSGGAAAAAVVRAVEGRATTPRSRFLLARYGITEIEFRALWGAQRGRCRICERHESEVHWRHGVLCVDHCHATDRVRGLLCYYCNVALGQFREDAVLMRAAMAYLEGAVRYAVV